MLIKMYENKSNVFPSYRDQILDICKRSISIITLAVYLLYDDLKSTLQ